MRKVSGLAALILAIGASSASAEVFRTRSHQTGFSLPGVSSSAGADEVRAADGTTCRSAVGHRGAYVDVGSVASQDDGRFGNASVYGRVIIPLGKRPRAIDCTDLYQLEMERLRMEVASMRRAIEEGGDPAVGFAPRNRGGGSRVSDAQAEAEFDRAFGYDGYDNANTVRARPANASPSRGDPHASRATPDGNPPPEPGMTVPPRPAADPYGTAPDPYATATVPAREPGTDASPDMRPDPHAPLSADSEGYEPSGDPFASGPNATPASPAAGPDTSPRFERPPLAVTGALDVPWGLPARGPRPLTRRVAPTTDVAGGTMPSHDARSFAGAREAVAVAGGSHDHLPLPEMARSFAPRPAPYAGLDTSADAFAQGGAGFQPIIEGEAGATGIGYLPNGLLAPPDIDVALAIANEMHAAPIHDANGMPLDPIETASTGTYPTLDDLEIIARTRAASAMRMVVPIRPATPGDWADTAFSGPGGGAPAAEPANAKAWAFPGL